MFWCILFLPLIGAIINGLILRKARPIVSQVVASSCMLLAFALSVVLFSTHFLTSSHSEPHIFELSPWLEAGSFVAPFHFILDQLSGLMLLIITGIGSLIHIYAGGYMHEEKSTSRFFAYLNLFVFMMLLLVLGDNFLVMFVGWEGVGLCSYLLIGYWFDDVKNAAAGMKAFLVNRIGDLGFLFGIFLIWTYFGTVSFSELRELFATSTFDAGQLQIITLATLALFVGVCGKSAQLPLYVWLPDAMAGPTPVSALIHAATMVTAGIYMMTRVSFLFYLSPTTQLVVAFVGALTALFAATIALVQTDIKKVLAYSTVSQLGYMVLACGVGAHIAGVFHLLTHACFKALLFLGAGSVIVAMHHEQNMLVMGGLKKKLPKTHLCMLIGVLAIIGFPGLSGFFSKDEILWKAFNFPVYGKALWSIGAIAAVCTAFYMVRLLFLTFYGPSRVEKHTEEHLHETPWHMWGPLAVLAFLSAVVGYLGIPPVFGVSNVFEHFLHSIILIPEQAQQHWEFLHHAHDHTLEWIVMGISVAGMLVGSGLAIAMYKNGPSKASESLKSRFSPIHSLLMDKYRVDELYDKVFVTPLKDLSMFLYKIVDVLIVDGVVNAIGQMSLLVSGVTSFKMSGSINRHAMLMIIGFVSLLIVLFS